jgi:hypothetical protein
MELDELHICKRGAGPRGEREALTKTGIRIGRLIEQTANPARRDDDSRRCKALRRAREGRENAGDTAVFDEQAAGLESFKDSDRWRTANRRDEPPHHLAARSVTRSVDNPMATMGGLQPERWRSVGPPVETHAKAQEVVDRHWGGARDPRGDFSVAETVAGSQSIGEMQLRLVILAEARSKAALRPCARRLSAERSLREDYDGLGR